jgi:uncharacterized damage-inducible protein DinB
VADTTGPEPWLQGTLKDVPAVPRAVLHALQLAHQDLQHWCGTLTEDELNARPAGLPSVGFHIRHIAGSVDRLLTYAEGNLLNKDQLQSLKTELSEHSNPAALFAELESALAHAANRIRALDSTKFEEPRKVGRNELPTTLGGLLVHVADHTQRHVGQAITTAKFGMTRLGGGGEREVPRLRSG